MRIPASVDYAVRAMAELAAAGPGASMKAEAIADAQQIPVKFLRSIMTQLRRERIVVSQRGPDGGFVLARPANEISVADIFRAIDGPLATVRDQSLSAMTYAGAARELPTVWMAVRAALRRVLETTTIDQVANDRLTKTVRNLADEYRVSTEQRHG
ncbi:MAG TPA: Rrf2 family transcriptional regulator [Ilumatobacteraceae bacterium]|nr:Rrf2 family transcriptional regulator [Ilumatobacteraceae bacterium]